MASKDLYKRLLLLKKNPKLAELLPQSEVIAYVTEVATLVETLKAAIEANKIKGKDGYTPQEGKDYYSRAQVDAYLQQALQSYEKGVVAMMNEVDRKAKSLTNGAPGKDAEITEGIKQSIAEMCRALIELPDFDMLITEALTSNNEATRDGLELFVAEEDKLKIEAIGNLRQELDDLSARIGREVRKATGGGIGKAAVIELIEQYSGGAGVPAGGLTGQVLTKASNTDGDATWQTSPTGVTDHGLLSGLADDDHTQYHTDARGDARYFTQAQVTSSLAGKANTVHGHVIADVTGLQTALDGKANTSHTHTASQITDFATAVAATAAVTANTAKVTNATHTGDVTGATALTLATVNSNVGSFGLAASVAQFTVNAKGLITAATNVAISITASAVTDFATTVRSTVLTGLSIATSTAVTATDSILVAIGKLQAQNTAQDTAIAGKADTVHTHTKSQVTDFQHSITGSEHTFPGGTINFLRADGTFAAPPSGFADPLTTNGDIIARISGATTRLPRGANDTFLGVQAGVLGYYTPPGVGSGITEAQAKAIARRYAIAL